MAQAILNPVNHVPDPAVRGFRKYCIVHNSFQMSDYEYMNDLYEFSGFERVVQSKLRLKNPRRSSSTSPKVENIAN